MAERPPTTVLDAFSVRHTPVPLPDGEGRTFAAGPIILQPVDDHIEAKWIAEVFRDLDGGDAFRVPRPVQARSGRWTIESWSAWERVDGAYVEGRSSEVLRVQDAFSSAIAAIPEPQFLRSRAHPWAIADRIAWGRKRPTSVRVEYAELLDRLTEARRPTQAMREQVIHGDLCGKLLFADGLPPAVIDFSPYVRPASYAKAIIAFEAVCWEGADPALLETIADVDDGRQLLVRAAIFRVAAAAILAGSERARHGEHATASYERMIRLIGASID